ncbi:hypothetical protein SEA_PLUMBUS_81 [Mycobacterium phage Plumbus]|uniref:Uncharacterized protein n=1 Tax=Mycobacterium phage Plumbus TaxID=2790994 RepID=A0A7T3N1M9_9CAUD|nr:hypothetical protein KNV67_gp081 [Mycobacterium phage Plumbus]QPX62778.1 hypothetical protein SEA_PLUMBUS_81 [Mycobacterium phage Plumbus]
MMAVHNHGPDDPANPFCGESMVGGKLTGECLKSESQASVRAVLTEALGKHHIYYLMGEDADRCTGCKWRGNGLDEFEGHLADVIASLPGVAVIQLPEPNSTRYEDDEFPPADRLAWWCPGSLFGISQWGYPNEVQIAYNGEPFEPVNIIEARFIAAALLAAAAAAVVAAGEEHHG